MTVNVEAALAEPGSTFAARLTDSLKDTGGLQLSPVTVDCRYVCTGDELVFTGTISTRVASRCDRCIAPVELELETDFDERFRKGEDTDEAYGYVGNTVSLDRLALDAVLLSMPMRTLCREDCRGLCPRCGQDLNAGSCSCDQAPPEDSPFAALRALTHTDGQ